MYNHHSYTPKLYTKDYWSRILTVFTIRPKVSIPFLPYIYIFGHFSYSQGQF